MQNIGLCSKNAPAGGFCFIIPLTLLRLTVCMAGNGLQPDRSAAGSPESIISRENVRVQTE